MERLLNLAQSEPVRLYVYGTLAAILVLLVVKGAVSDEDATYYLQVGAGVLGVPAVEFARSKVASPLTQKVMVNDAVSTLNEAGYEVVDPDDRR